MQVQSTASTSRTCQQCGRVYAKTPGRGNRTGSGAKFCSNACRGMSMRGKVERICESCGSAFPVTPAVIRNGGGKFCSKRCYGDSKVVKVSRYCDQCGTPYSIRRDTFEAGMGRYCSKSCSNRGRALPFAERFWVLVAPADENGCRDWQGARDKDGYGLVTLTGGKQQMAHRAAYELTYGPLGDLKALHTCDRPPCCEPAHLFKGTHQDNSDDKITKKRHRFGERHPFAKLTEGAVRKIRADYADGIPMAMLADEHNVAIGAIWSVVVGRTWKDVV
jgi:hypothetical protein